jgi:hypothetical protein
VATDQAGADLPAGGEDLLGDGQWQVRRRALRQQEGRQEPARGRAPRGHVVGIEVDGVPADVGGGEGDGVAGQDERAVPHPHGGGVLAGRGAARVRLRLANRTYRSHSFNVVGDIPGGQAAHEIILVGGHYDGHDIAQAAADDAAGTLVGLEVGRVLAPFAGQLRRTLRIICFGYEELGLGGSWAHADRYAAAGGSEQLRLALNLDGAGRGRGGQEQITVTGDPALEAYVAQLPAKLHYAFETGNRISAHSDHFPFFLAGFPSASLSSQDATAGMIGRGYGHTEGDTVDKVSLRGLQMGAALAARVALDLAMVEPFPVERRTEAAVRAALDQAQQSHVLVHHWGRANRVGCGRRQMAAAPAARRGKYADARSPRAASSTSGGVVR